MPMLGAAYANERKGPLPTSTLSRARARRAPDKVSKVRELRRAGGESRLRKRRLVHYRHCLTLLQRRLPDSPLVAQLHIELAGLARDSGELAHAGIL